MQKIALLVVLVCLSPMAVASPTVKVPTLSVCLQTNGNLAVKQRCSSSEKKLNGNAIGALGIQGPQGPKGDPGPPGQNAALDGTPAGGDLAGTFPNPLLAANEPWQLLTAPFGSEFIGIRWGNYGTPHAPVGFFKDRLGLVHLGGLACPFSNGCSQVAFNSPLTMTIFSLPPGYRPIGTRIFTTLSGGPTRAQRLDITPSGDVNVELLAFTNYDWVALDGISFRAEQ